jgi:hypothetical protein
VTVTDGNAGGAAVAVWACASPMDKHPAAIVTTAKPRITRIGFRGALRSIERARSVRARSMNGIPTFPSSCLFLSERRDSGSQRRVNAP